MNFAALSFAITSGAPWVRILPAGRFRSADGSGRPDNVIAWQLDAGLAAALIARLAGRVDDKVVDYEHQTLKSAENGQPAPAAGWMREFAWRDPAFPGEPGGLYARIEWTPKAASMIAAQEYRYLSPVFSYDAEGRVLDLFHCGLVNFAGLDGLVDLAALSARFPHTSQEDTTMNETLKKLLAALGLPDTTSEADALAGVTALKATAAEQTTQIATLKASASDPAKPDPAKYVSVEVMKTLQTEVAALSARLSFGEASAVIEEALASGRLLPAQKVWAEELGKSDLAALKAFVSATPANPALAGTQTQGKAPEGGGRIALSGAQLSVCAQLGIETKDFQAAQA